MRLFVGAASLVALCLASTAAGQSRRDQSPYSISSPSAQSYRWSRPSDGYVSSEEDNGAPAPGEFYYKPLPSSYSSSATRYNGGGGGVWRPAKKSRRPQASRPSSSSYRPYSYHSPSSSPSSSYNPQFRPVSGPNGGGNGGGGDVSTLPLPDALSSLGFRLLVNLVERAGLVDTLADAERSFTVFAPTDDALEEFLESQSAEVSEALEKGGDALSSLLLNHVVPGSVSRSDLSPGSSIMAVGGAELEVRESKDGVLVGGASLSEGSGGARAANGFVHSVDDVIFPFESQGPEKKAVRPRLLGLDDDDPRLIVEVSNGRVRGINVDKEQRAWMGIPYAKPPLGELRFSPPQPAEPWHDDGILETREPPKACQQTPDTAFGDFPGATQWNADTASEVSEDCLYLNVHAPRNFTGKLPVLVWIYGGGYMTGSAALDVYRPDALVTSGDGLVYVAMQYRTNMHGFLYMGEGSGAPGNAGLMDQVMALEWVRDNIDAFGGNPDDVTIMGESAGANSVALHLSSEKSCNLFQKAILQSTGLNPRWGYSTPSQAKEKAEKLAEKLGCGEEDSDSAVVDCLREVTSEELRALEFDADVVGPYTVNLYPWNPTTDGEFIKASPGRLLKESAFAQGKPVLIGTNANEGFWSLIYLDFDTFPNRELEEKEMTLTEDEYQAQVDNIFSFYPAQVRSLIAHEYRDRFTGPTRFFFALDQMVAESDFVCNAESFAQALSDGGADVYRYYYGHRSSQDPWPSYAGVKHGDEIEFTFGRPLRPEETGKYSADEVGLAEDVVTYWTNFAKTGSPNPTQLRSWPTYSSPDWRYLNLTAEATTVGRNTMRDNCVFWNDVLPKFLEEELTEEEIEEEDEADFGVCQE